MNKCESNIISNSDLGETDFNSKDLNVNAISVIMERFNCSNKDIKNIKVLKKGMTNKSYYFEVNKAKFIIRIPGEGTYYLINRKEESDVYDVIKGLELCDDPVYIDADSGYKITKYIDNVRVCDPFNNIDLEKCMKKLRRFHDMKLKVNHYFDLFEKIDYYETLRGDNKSIYNDYSETKNNVKSLRKFIDENVKELQLTHIDAVPDNFLFCDELKGELSLQLTDWEYAAMQDKDVDIAMFCIYAMYDKQQIDNLIEIYFKQDGGYDIETRIKIYCYISVCGLLWSNWCEYKRTFGVEFGEYSTKQYNYAKEFYNYAKELMEGIDNV